MATPIGHSLAGYAISSFSKTAKGRNQFSLLLLCIVMANAPDLDFLPGILVGKPVLYHQGITHSLGFAFMISLLVSAVYKIRGNSFFAIFSLCFILYLSHLIIDFFGGSDNRPPYGIPLFWPVSGEYFISPIPLFLGVRHTNLTSASTMEWIDGILDLYNIGAIALEVVLVVPFIILGQIYKRKSLN